MSEREAAWARHHAQWRDTAQVASQWEEAAAVDPALAWGVVGPIAGAMTAYIIVLTARGDEENEVRVFELGADDFLSKPFRARALSARIQAVLARTKH